MKKVLAGGIEQVCVDALLSAWQVQRVRIQEQKLRACTGRYLREILCCAVLDSVCLTQPIQAQR